MTARKTSTPSTPDEHEGQKRPDVCQVTAWEFNGQVYQKRGDAERARYEDELVELVREFAFYDMQPEDMAGMLKENATRFVCALGPFVGEEG